MALSGFALCWLLLAVGCLLAGTFFTLRRQEQPPEEEARRVPVRAVCRGCGELMDRGARFCGMCGKYCSVKDRWQTIKVQRAKPSRR